MTHNPAKNSKKNKVLKCDPVKSRLSLDPTRTRASAGRDAMRNASYVDSRPRTVSKFQVLSTFFRQPYHDDTGLVSYSSLQYVHYIRVTHRIPGSLSAHGAQAGASVHVCFAIFPFVVSLPMDIRVYTGKLEHGHFSSADFCRDSCM